MKLFSILLISSTMALCGGDAVATLSSSGIHLTRPDNVVKQRVGFFLQWQEQNEGQPEPKIERPMRMGIGEHFASKVKLFEGGDSHKEKAFFIPTQRIRQQISHGIREKVSYFNQWQNQAQSPCKLGLGKQDLIQEIQEQEKSSPLQNVGKSLKTSQYLETQQDGDLSIFKHSHNQSHLDESEIAPDSFSLLKSFLEENRSVLLCNPVAEPDVSTLLTVLDENQEASLQKKYVYRMIKDNHITRHKAFDAVASKRLGVSLLKLIQKIPYDPKIDTMADEDYLLYAHKGGYYQLSHQQLEFISQYKKLKQHINDFIVDVKREKESDKEGGWLLDLDQIS